MTLFFLNLCQRNFSVSLIMFVKVGQKILSSDFHTCCLFWPTCNTELTKWATNIHLHTNLFMLLCCSNYIKILNWQDLRIFLPLQMTHGMEGRLRYALTQKIPGHSFVKICPFIEQKTLFDQKKVDLILKNFFFIKSIFFKCKNEVFFL